MKRNWYSMVSQIQVHRNDPKPIQYILGGTFFCGEWFVVTPDVLIPRFETETLVEYITEKCKTTPTRGTHAKAWVGCPDAKCKIIRVLDLGTGCGNIAIILAKRLGCKIYAVDISNAALNAARRNAKIHGVSDKIKFYKSDWYNELDIEQVDVIVSNPPYVAEGEWDFLSIEVKDYEPRIALWGGRGGMEHYKKIISGAKKMLVPGGRIVLEVGYNQTEAVKELLGGFEDVEVIKDQFGIPRVVSGKYGGCP